MASRTGFQPGNFGIEDLCANQYTTGAFSMFFFKFRYIGGGGGGAATNLERLIEAGVRYIAIYVN